MIARIPSIGAPDAATLSRARLFSVCGNLLAFTHAAREQTSAALAALCWEDGRRIADGVAEVRSVDDGVLVRFVNPDGTDDFCGNALLGVCRFLEMQRVRVRSGVLDAVAEGRKSPVLTIAGLDLDIRNTVLRGQPASLVDVGTEHCVTRADSVPTYPLEEVGRHVTRELGANLTVYDVSRGVVAARTFERGVEDETRGCGTGAIAVQVIRGRDQGEVSFPGGTYGVTLRRRQGRTAISIEIAAEAIAFLRDI